MFFPERSVMTCHIIIIIIIIIIIVIMITNQGRRLLLPLCTFSGARRGL